MHVAWIILNGIVWNFVRGFLEFRGMPCNIPDVSIKHDDVGGNKYSHYELTNGTSWIDYLLHSVGLFIFYCYYNVRRQIYEDWYCVHKENLYIHRPNVQIKRRTQIKKRAELETIQ